MEVGIIGGGFTGLSAGHYLKKRGIPATILEKESIPGGLAIGFKDSTWDWPLEMHYHHLFSSDYDILNLADEVGVPINFSRPETSIFFNNHINQFDSPLTLLSFPYLDPISKLRVSAITAGLKISPYFPIMDTISASGFLKNTEGSNAYQTLWEPLFTGKFGHFADQISLSWYWARIKKRSMQLGYPEGGFQNLATKISEKLNIKYEVNIKSIDNINNKFIINTETNNYSFDKLIFTLSFAQLQKYFPDLKLPEFKSLGAVNLVLAMNKPFLKDTYWLNINDRKYPFLALVEHTNFIDPKHYNNQHLLYIGNYLPANHKYFKFSATRLFKEFLPYLKQINPEFTEESVLNSRIFKTPFAQPVMETGYKSLLPNPYTLIPNLFVANMQLVYPYDRGTNYAVESGRKAVEFI